jgi:hypothetical protein
MVVKPAISFIASHTRRKYIFSPTMVGKCVKAFTIVVFGGLNNVAPSS